MRPTIVLTAALAILSLVPLAHANPDEVQEENIQDAEAPAGGGQSKVVPRPAHCYEIDNAEAFVDYASYPTDDYGLHALAWKAYKTANAIYTPPPNAPAGPPRPTDLNVFHSLEANASVFHDPITGLNVNPHGQFTNSDTPSIKHAMANIALAVTVFGSPAYVELNNYTTRQIGDLEAFAVERLSIATAGQPFADVCDCATPNSASFCKAGTGMWWTIGEVEGLAYFEGGGTQRMTFSGADFTSLVEDSLAGGLKINVIHDADWGPGNSISTYFTNTASWALAPHYQRWASAQGCADQDLGDAFE